MLGDQVTMLGRRSGTTCPKWFCRLVLGFERQGSFGMLLHVSARSTSLAARIDVIAFLRPCDQQLGFKASETSGPGA